MKQAVCLLLKVTPTNTEYGGYVCVSRRGDPYKWGLPGGKVEDGETLIDAIVRETFEEIGFELDRSLLKEVFSQGCVGEVDYQTTTFTYPGITYELADKLMPESDSFNIAVFEEKHLSDPKLSPFAEYNKALFIKVNGDPMDEIEDLLDHYIVACDQFRNSQTCCSQTYKDQEQIMYDIRYELLDKIRQHIEGKK